MSRHRAPTPRRRPGGIAVAALTAGVLLATGGVTASTAAWTDREWDAAALGALDCAAVDATSTAAATVLGGTLLGLDLDSVAAVEGLRVDHDGATAQPDPASADPVPGSGGTAYRDPLVISAAADAISLDLGGLAVLTPPLATGTGVYGQVARASGDGSSAAGAGLVTESGAVDLDALGGPAQSRPSFGTLELGTLLESALGAGLADVVADELTDARLGLGAVAGAATLDGCGAAWGGAVYDELSREYAIAGLDLGLESPVVGELSTAAAGAVGDVESGVNGLTGSSGVASTILSGVLGALSGVLGSIGVSSPTLDLAVTVDLAAAEALLDDTVSDEEGIVEIDPAAGVATVDLAALAGAAWGTDGLNGLPPNSELLVDDALLATLGDAATDAVAAWVADVVAAVDEALGLAHVAATVHLPLRATLLGAPVTLGVLDLAVSASLADLLDGDAVVDVQMNQAAGLCALPLVGTLACGLVTGLLDALTPAVLDSVALAIGSPVAAALDALGAGLEPALDAALDAPVAALLGLLDDSLVALLGVDGVLSVLVNAQNDPDPAATGAGPEPAAWATLPGPSAGPPVDTGRFDVAALRLGVVGAVDAVAIDLGRASVGGNVVGG